jgi:2',3'-cyclic-nucleotide 2'-phosphodiesterase (5'-nucleotidase family)
MTRLTILHTNDLHGRVTQGLRIAALAKQIKHDVETGGGYCTLWDAGDAEDTVLYESSITKGQAMMVILRGAGYELEALGNASPSRYGPQSVAGLADGFGRRLLCANMIDPATSQLVNGLEPYTLQVCGDLTLGIIGLTAVMRNYATFFRLQLREPAEILPGLITEARDHGAQTIILLSHLGSKQDSALAEQIQGLDVIIGAHDHVELNPPLVVNQTIIAQAGDYGRFLGRLDLDLDSFTGKVVQYQGKLIPITEELPIDPAARQAFEDQQAEVQRFTARVIGTAVHPIELAHDRECPAGNLLAEALRERMQGEVGLVLSGHWQSGLSDGDITMSELYDACRSTANPGVAQLTGNQIWQFLHEALRPDNMRKSPNGLRGAPAGMPHVSGMRVRYHPARLDALEVEINHAALQPDRVYLVAASDMELSDFIGYLAPLHGNVSYELPTIMSEVLEDYLARHSPIGSFDQRFFFRED